MLEIPWNGVKMLLEIPWEGSKKMGFLNRGGADINWNIAQFIFIADSNKNENKRIVTKKFSEIYVCIFINEVDNTKTIGNNKSIRETKKNAR